MKKPLIILLALAALPLGACSSTSNGQYGYNRPGYASDRYDRRNHRHDRDRNQRDYDRDQRDSYDRYYGANGVTNR